MATEQQNKNLQNWFKHSLILNDQAITSMNELYEFYCNDIRHKGQISTNVSLPVRPKAFATEIKKYARSKDISGKVQFFYLRRSQVQGWEYVPKQQLA